MRLVHVSDPACSARLIRTKPPRESLITAKPQLSTPNPQLSPRLEAPRLYKSVSNALVPQCAWFWRPIMQLNVGCVRQVAATAGGNHPADMTTLISFGGLPAWFCVSLTSSRSLH